MSDRIENALIIAIVIYFTIANYCNFKEAVGLPLNTCPVKCQWTSPTSSKP